MKRIGYARVSTIEQNLDRQIGALKGEKCDRIFAEKASGKDTANRPQLAKAIDALGKGDLLIVAEWDRATRSMNDGLKILERIADRGAMVKVLDRAYLDLTTPIGRGIMALLSAMAEDERQRIVRRGKQGMAYALARGVKFGRRPKLDAHQQAEARKMIAAGQSHRQVGKTFGVSHKVIGRLA
jgi:DNA invertase Pin-like site-specific DNA recombinase